MFPSSLTDDLARRLERAWPEVARQWSICSFRAGQAEGLRQILDGRDLLMVMPTGSGKSLIYQLGAQCLPGRTVVVSPLIALMSDQVRGLRARGVAAEAVHSQRPPGENSAALESGCKLLYVAPERFRRPDFLAALATRPLSRLVVDEAHCVTQWGHDFRPDYLYLKEAALALGSPPVAALTATATSSAQDEIARLLGLREPFRMVTGFDRPNLRFGRLRCRKHEKLAVLDALLRSREGPALIYTGTRRAAEEVAAELRAVTRGLVLTYHGGMPAGMRERALKAFLAPGDVIMVATNAFGMGVDRPDLGLVLHHSLPGSLEAYYQEAGRAGRGGQPASAFLLYDPDDRKLHEWFIRQSMWTPRQYRELLGRIERGQEVSEHTFRVALDHLEREGRIARQGGGWRAVGDWGPAVEGRLVRHSERLRVLRSFQLTEMVRYAESGGCRRRHLLQHFGQPLGERPAECCDNCGWRARAAA